MCASTNGTSSRVGREWNGTRRLCINQRNQCDGDEDHGDHQRHGEARRKTRHGWLSYARCKESDISVYEDGRIEPGASERSWSICGTRDSERHTRRWTHNLHPKHSHVNLLLLCTRQRWGDSPRFNANELLARARDERARDDDRERDVRGRRRST